MISLKQTRAQLTLSQRIIAAIIAVFIFSVSIGVYRISFVEAVTEQELRDQSATLENQIKKNESVLVDLEDKIGTLDGKVRALDTEISIAQQKIALTEVKIKELKLSLKAAEKELVRQQEILEETLITLYIEGDTSSLELIFASENFGEYFAEQQYLESLKISVQDSVDKVAELKEKIDQEKTEQEDLQRSQKANRQILSSKRTEQSALLEETKGQEAAYQQLNSNLQQQLLDAQAELEELLAAQNFVSLGSVSRGDIIGYAGSSGYSTGPHLHFAAYQNGTFVNPYAGGGQMTLGLSWPLPTVSSSAVSQLYGCQSSIVYLTSCGSGSWLHSGLDVSAWYGEPIAAAADGEIVFRGSLGGYGNAVIIDHGNGLQTYYAHMNE